ncbi:MAG: GtrA family protein [Thermogemmatispora sp.]|uniref:GtrA family protein n=1 Tax=Thermogemmatispora sp. TaxID=1968838 RepID=UPI0019EE3CB7|nr:GtrA family protein [Thermogemmatispora sp.]MBE3565232.1 GtrA family protein [Thermogemmatispora sp.]
MKNTITQDRQDDLLDLMALVEHSTQPQPAVSASGAGGAAAQGSAPGLPSYQPTSLALVNRFLALVDDLTGGKAGWFQRLFTYLFIGGAAAVVNMVVFYIMFYRMSIPVNSTLHNAIANITAAEISIIANFLANDYFTFRHLPGHQRSWGQRCLRFHLTAIVGSLLNFCIELGLTNLAHVPALLSQAIAIFLVLIYNFSFHHIFTYGGMSAAH